MSRPQLAHEGNTFHPPANQHSLSQRQTSIQGTLELDSLRLELHPLSGSVCCLTGTTLLQPLALAR